MLSNLVSKCVRNYSVQDCIYIYITYTYTVYMFNNGHLGSAALWLHFFVRLPEVTFYHLATSSWHEFQ